MGDVAAATRWRKVSGTCLAMKSVVRRRDLSPFSIVDPMTLAMTSLLLSRAARGASTTVGGSTSRRCGPIEHVKRSAAAAASLASAGPIDAAAGSREG